MNIVHKHISEIAPMTEQRAKEIEAISEENIDCSDIPELDENFFKTAKRVDKNQTKTINNNVPLTIILDQDMAKIFTTSEEVNNALRAFIAATSKK